MLGRLTLPTVTPWSVTKPTTSEEVAPVPKEIETLPTSHSFCSLHASNASVALGTATRLTKAVDDDTGDKEGTDVGSTDLVWLDVTERKGDVEID